MNIQDTFRWNKCYKLMNVKDVVQNLKHKTGEKENTAQNDAKHCITRVDNLRKAIHGMKRLNKKESRNCRPIQAEECLGKNIVNRQRNKCLKAANSHTTTWMVDTMEKSKQKSVRFAENLRKEYSFIIRMGTEKIIKFQIYWLSVINAIANSMHHKETKQESTGKTKEKFENTEGGIIKMYYQKKETKNLIGFICVNGEIKRGVSDVLL